MLHASGTRAGSGGPVVVRDLRLGRGDTAGWGGDALGCGVLSWLRLGLRLGLWWGLPLLLARVKGCLLSKSDAADLYEVQN